MLKDTTLKLMNVMKNSYEILEGRGLTDDVLRKAKFICPDLIEKSYRLQDKIDLIFLRDQELLKNPTKWDDFVNAHVLPWFECWLMIINCVTGKKTGIKEIVEAAK